MATTTLAALRPELETRVGEAAERLQVPGVAVGLVLGAEQVSVYHGITSVENPLPVDEHTLFLIGSEGKTFTALAIMRLRDAGRLRLDEPVRTYVPELELQDEDVARRVTVRQLLNHTAGWRGDHFPDTGQGDDALARYVETMAELEQETPLGEAASYNNASLCLAGRVIEKVTGQTYERAIHDLILAPLGMDHSFFLDHEVMVRRFAVGHNRRDDELVLTRRWNMARGVNPAGGLACTIEDQLRWARFHLEGGQGIVPTATLDEMWTPTAELGEERIGITWMTHETAGVRMVGHGGNGSGQVAEFQLAPDRRFAVIVLTNAEHGHELCQEIVDWSLEAALGVVVEEPEPLALAPDELRPYAGRYGLRHMTLDVSLEGSGLRARAAWTDEGRAMLKELDEDEDEPPDLCIGLLDGDRFVVTEGGYKGLKGRFVRAGDGVSGIDLGGRLAMRVP
jgi:CubicO group peptidase (beta-lactamase class C family)